VERALTDLAVASVQSRGAMCLRPGGRGEGPALPPNFDFPEDKTGGLTVARHCKDGRTCERIIPSDIGLNRVFRSSNARRLAPDIGPQPFFVGRVAQGLGGGLLAQRTGDGDGFASGPGAGGPDPSSTAGGLSTARGAAIIRGPGRAHLGNAAAHDQRAALRGRRQKRRPRA